MTDTSQLSPEIQQLLKDEKILLVDKPSGMTSHDVVNQTRWKTGVKRVGHAGTLDPLASGLLIVLVSREATRVQDTLLHLEKEYVFTAQLGVETDTYDTDGQVLKEWPWEEIEHITQEDLEKSLEKFRGSYDQQVPAYSAVKRNGQKLYELARQKQEIDLPFRHVTILKLELLRFEKDEKLRKIYFSCTVSCGAGTYIRSLAVDIGRSLGTCATITALRRTKIGPFTL